jgi:hypothetical protein
VQSRGKTYDDLEEILKKEGDGKISTPSTHVISTSIEEEQKIDYSKVVKVKP